MPDEEKNEELPRAEQSEGDGRVKELEQKIAEYENKFTAIQSEKEQAKIEDLKKREEFKTLYEEGQAQLNAINERLQKAEKVREKYEERVKGEWSGLAESIPDNFKHFFLDGDSIDVIEANLVEFEKLKKAGLFDKQVESDKKHKSPVVDGLNEKIKNIFKIN